MDRSRFSPLLRQIFTMSGIFSTILSCGLGLGFVSILMDQKTYAGNNFQLNESAARSIEIAGEISFVPSIIIMPITMQRKGRRIASFVTTLPLIVGWTVALIGKTEIHFMLTNIFHSIAIGGAIANSSVIISEYCSPKYRAVFLMLETVMLSLGLLITHVCAVCSYANIIPFFGMVFACLSSVIVYLWPESPYWLIDQGHIVRSTDTFYWLRGHDEESRKEMDDILKTFKAILQIEALRPILKLSLRERIVTYLKSLMNIDFLKPLSIMILLFSFVGFGGESLFTSFSFRDIFNRPNGKYIGTIILDVMSVICSLAACVLVQLVKRKTLFIFTGSISIIFLTITSLFVFLQTLDLLSPDYAWLFLVFGTLFAIFMSLGTTALPLSLLGEIFPLSYKGIGSSLTCAYLWAFGNSVVKFVPQFSKLIGLHGVLFTFIVMLILILALINKIMPETSGKSLIEIEENVITKSFNNDIYHTVTMNENQIGNFDKLKLFIEYV